MGTLKLGKPACMPVPPLATTNERTVSVSIFPKMTKTETTTIAVSAAGTFLVR